MIARNWPAALIAGVATIFLQSPAHAENELSINQSLGLIKTVKLVVKDNVTGNCWTNVSHVQQNTRWKLEQSSIAVEKEVDFTARPANALVYVYGAGRRVRGTCFGSIDVEVTRLDRSTYRDTSLTTEVRLYRCGSFGWGSSINDTITSTVDECIAELAADVLRARRDPAVRKAMETTKSRAD